MIDAKDATKDVKWHTANRGDKGGVERVGEVVIDGFGVHKTQPQSLRSQLVCYHSFIHSFIHNIHYNINIIITISMLISLLSYISYVYNRVL